MYQEGGFLDKGESGKDIRQKLTLILLQRLKDATQWPFLICHIVKLLEVSMVTCRER